KSTCSINLCHIAMMQPHLFFRPNRYLFPAIHLNGSLAEMLFADCVYYLLTVRGETNYNGERYVETTTQELETLTGLTRKTIRKEIDRLLNLPAPYTFLEEDGIIPNGRVLKQPNFNNLPQHSHLFKPLELINNHWGWVMGQALPQNQKISRFPLAILNLLLRKPNGRSASVYEFQKRTQKAGAKKLPDLNNIWRALSFLQSLEVIQPENENHFKLNAVAFKQDGRARYTQLVNDELSKQSITWEWPADFPDERVNTAKRLAALGNFNPHEHGVEIMQALSLIQPNTDLKLLEYAVKRHRNRPPSANRWQNCWQLFENKLNRARASSKTEKFRFSFYPNAEHVTQFVLPDHKPDRLRWGKIVIWVADSRFVATGIGRETEIQVKLDLNSEFLWQRSITHEDSLLRADCTGRLRQTKEPNFTFKARAPEPLRQFRIDVQIEAQYIL
ncbi:MAG: hypothetical protein AAGD96_16110, partial [Chloroflexota bacterium]